MSLNPEFTTTFPLEIHNNIPTYEMPDHNSCVPTVARSVIGYFEPEHPISPELIDAALDRQPGEPATVDSFVDFLDERGYETISMQVWDCEAFIENPRAYARHFYGMDTSEPRIAEEHFEGYYTNETLAALKEKFEQELTKVEPNSLKKTVIGIPAIKDIQKYLVDDYLVTVIIQGGENAGTHFALVSGYEYTNSGLMFDVFNPNPGYYTGIVRYSEDSLCDEWMPEEGITALRLT